MHYIMHYIVHYIVHYIMHYIMHYVVYYVDMMHFATQTPANPEEMKDQMQKMQK